jgi:arginine-tRNA-protein transferase
MGSMTIDEFSSMVENSPISTFLIDYRDTDNALLASVLVDLQSDGLSAVYSFFEPECPDRSFGSFIILDLIERVQQSEASYLYLGYYIAESRKMSYKARYTPFEIFHAGRWQPGSSLA